jgi:SPP1 gp7 family putative phage head morphogenesis protein
VIRPDDVLEAHMREAFNLPKAVTTREEDKENNPSPAPPPPLPAEEDEDLPPDGGDDPDPNVNDKEQEPEPKLSDRPAWAPFRALTIYEQPMMLSEMAAEFEDSRLAITQVMKAHVSALAVYAVAQLSKRFSQGPTSRTKVASKIEFQTKEYERALLKAMAKAVALGSKQAKRDLEAKSGGKKFADSIKSNLEFLPEHVQEVLKKQAKLQAETHAAEMKKILDHTVMSADATGIPDKDVVSDVEDRLTEFTDSNKVNGAGRTVTVQSINRGRDGFFFDKSAIKQIQAFQYSAVLDDRTTDICLSLDGKIFKPNDPSVDRLRPPNHHGCRSIMVPITINEEEPELTGLDIDPSNQSLLDEYERRGKEPPDMATIKKSRNL